MTDMAEAVDLMDMARVEGTEARALVTPVPVTIAEQVPAMEIAQGMEVGGPAAEVTVALQVEVMEGGPPVGDMGLVTGRAVADMETGKFFWC